MNTNKIASMLVTITPHDPPIFRDGRPFRAGEGANRARSLHWPFPSTVAGAIRTLLGKVWADSSVQDPFSDPQFLTKLKEMAVEGPLPLKGGRLYVPTPRDTIAFAKAKAQNSVDWVHLQPRALKPGEGCNLPDPHTLLPIEIPRSDKPLPMPAFWSMDDVVTWLSSTAPKAGFAPEQTLTRFEKEERLHVSIDPKTQTAATGMLFTTQGLAIPNTGNDAVAIACLVKGQMDGLQRVQNQSFLQTFGGERRLALFQTETVATGVKCPSPVEKALDGTSGVRMQLATPAIFAGGWLPGWLNCNTLEGVPPVSGLHNIRLRLRGAALGRWQAVSGWSMEKGTRGPKPIRRVVPAGSVYFFEVIAGSATALSKAWFAPVSDDQQDRNDGFGVALWGVWNCQDAMGGCYHGR